MLKKSRTRGGLSLVEVVIAIASIGILTFAIGAFLGNGQRTWNRLFDRVYKDSTVDGFSAYKVFSSICRKSSARKCVIGADGDTLELYYWDLSSSASTPENYVQFYLQSEVLYVQHGKLYSGTWQPDTSTAATPINLANQVESVKFETQGNSIQMYLVFNDKNIVPVVCSSVRHND